MVIGANFSDAEVFQNEIFSDPKIVPKWTTTVCIEEALFLLTPGMHIHFIREQLPSSGTVPNYLSCLTFRLDDAGYYHHVAGIALPRCQKTQTKLEVLP